MFQGEYVLIPQEKYSILALVERTQIKEICRIDIPYNTKSVISSNKLIVVLDGQEGDSYSEFQRKLTIFDFKGKVLARFSANDYFALNIKGNIVYLGGTAGEQGNQKLYLLDLNQQTWNIKSINIPYALDTGKAIDEILVFENKLFLIDNVVLPLYIFEYDITNPLLPQFVKEHEIPETAPWEHILKGDINQKWIVLLSSSLSSLGSFNYIRVSTHDLKKYFTLNVANNSRFVNNSGIEIKDIALFKDYIFILSNKGLSYLKLDRLIKSSQRKFQKTINDADFWNESFSGDKLIRTDQCLIVVNKTLYKTLFWNDIL